MAEDEDRPRPTVPQIGEDLSELSVAELESRITLLESEISRIRREIEEKRRVRSQAETVFKT